MILDRLESLDRYICFGRNFETAIQYLKTQALNDLPLGRHAVDGENVIAIVEDYQTKLHEKAVWESHRKYADIQVVVAGTEMFGIGSLAESWTIKTDYIPERDVMFYEPGSRFITVTSGSCLIFFPEDIHAPGLAPGEPQQPGPVRKVVMKVRLEAA